MLRELLARALAARSAVGAHHLTGFDDLFEAAQIVVKLLVGFLAEVLSHRPAERSGRDVVADGDADLGAAVPGGRHEPYLTGVLDVGVADRAPADPTARLVELTRLAGVARLTGFTDVSGVAGIPGVAGSADDPELLTDRKP